MSDVENDTYDNALEMDGDGLIDASVEIERDEGAILMQRYVEGDQTALTNLVSLYHENAIRLVCINGISQAEAEDVVQEAWIKVMMKVHQFDANLPFAPWFNRILINTARDKMRYDTRHHFPVFSSADFDGVIDIPSSRTHPSSEVPLRMAVNEALEQLGPRYREVLWGVYIEGHTTKEMVDSSTPTPDGDKPTVCTIRWRLGQARSKFKQFFLE